MADTPGVNPEIQSADSIEKWVLYGAAENAAIVALDAQMPWLKLPFINGLVHGIIHLAAEWIFTYLSKFVSFQIIDSQVAGEDTDYAKAKAEFLIAHASGDPSAIEKAIADLRLAADRLVHADGS